MKIFRKNFFHSVVYSMNNEQYGKVFKNVTVVIVFKVQIAIRLFKM